MGGVGEEGEIPIAAWNLLISVLYLCIVVSFVC
jgi:hypothetical protein